MKKAVDSLDAVPSKRLFQSIIADYDLNRSICELVDNALDVWVRGGRIKPVTVKITLDPSQQTIVVQDDAGGLPKSDLRFVIAPGQTGTAPTDETIGIFGVGTKRAVVALAQHVSIRTRFPKEATHLVEFDDQWLGDDDDWTLPIFEVDDIPPGCTIVELWKLREHISSATIDLLTDHLRTTYAKFLRSENVTIDLNGIALSPLFFENWAYPPKYSPLNTLGH